MGAADVTFVGTEPIRRAADAGAIVHQTQAATGAPLHVVSHEEEAFLTLIGVTEGMPVTQQTLVVDVGGGSSEFVIVDAVGSPRAAGLRVGSAMLTGRFVTHDPATPTEVGAMRAAAIAAVRDAPDATPGEIVAVGGTASNLLKILPAAALDRTLSRERIVEVEAILGVRAGGRRRGAPSHQPHPGPDPAGRWRDHACDPRPLWRRADPCLRGGLA